mgnify:CR=1 FL=1
MGFRGDSVWIEVVDGISPSDAPDVLGNGFLENEVYANLLLR